MPTSAQRIHSSKGVHKCVCVCMHMRTCALVLLNKGEGEGELREGGGEKERIMQKEAELLL